MAYDVNLNFMHADWTVRMPAVPQKGDRVEFADPDLGDTSWDVTEVAYTAYVDGTEGSINLALDPADDETKALADRYMAAKRAVIAADRADEK
jgi:hypothetical protein